jgi:hypothetical protein
MVTMAHHFKEVLVVEAQLLMPALAEVVATLAVAVVHHFLLVMAAVPLVVVAALLSTVQLLIPFSLAPHKKATVS